MTRETAIPAAITDLTPTWLTRVFKSSGALGDARVTSVSAEVLGGNTGLMSHIVRLSLAYDRPETAAPSTVIAKFPPIDAASQATGVHLGFFEGECGFYRDLAAISAIRAPRCYFTRYDRSTGRFFTLLEDLSSARLGDISAGCSINEATNALEILVRFHAPWWNNEALPSAAWLRTRGQRLTQLIEMLPEAWPLFAARFRDALAPANFSALSMVEGVVSRSHDTLATQPFALIHGDFKLDNLFFQPSGEIVVADWGVVMAGPPMFDVATFLGLNLPSAERRAEELRLLHVYVDLLAECGVRDYDFDAAFRDYKLQLFALLPQIICAGGLAEFAGEWAITQYAVSVERLLDAVTQHEVIDYLEAS